MKKSLFFGLIASVVMLASCGKLQKPDQITVTPGILELKGGKVAADITGTFPVKKFAKKGVLTVTPVLKFNGKEVLGQPVTYVGEKAKENGTTVKFKEGGTYSQHCEFDFVPEMATSELYLRFDAHIGKKVVNIPDVKVADGVITTPVLARANDNATAATPDKFQRVIQELTEADIKFLIHSSLDILFGQLRFRLSFWLCSCLRFRRTRCLCFRCSLRRFYFFLFCFFSCHNIVCF